MKKIDLLVIIPARSGSKSIKNKNLANLSGKPLIYYSLKIASKIKENNIIICSTDSEKIKKVSLKYGIDVPFLRPKKISNANSRDIEFVNFTLEKFKEKNYVFKNGLILRPTSPLRKIKYITKAYKIFKKDESLDSMRAIVETKNTPYKMWKIKNDILSPALNSKIKEFYNAPRQKLPKIYWQTGNFEFFRINFKKRIKRNFGKKIYGFKIDNDFSTDIDEWQDIKFAEYVMKKINFKI